MILLCLNTFEVIDNVVNKLSSFKLFLNNLKRTSLCFDISYKLIKLLFT